MSRRWGKRQWGIYDLDGVLLEGGFFAKAAAEVVALASYDIGTVKVKVQT